MVDNLESLRDVVSQLRTVELFSALDEDNLAAVAGLAHEEHHPEGSLVFAQGEAGRGCQVVISGELRALRVDPNGVQREIGRFSPGDFFGESSLLLGEPHDTTVEALEDSVLLAIYKDELDQLVADRPSILEELRMSPEIEQRRRAPRFDWQDTDEVVVFVLHKHNVILLRRLLLPGLALLLILVGFFLVGSASIGGLIFGGILASFPLLFALYQIVDHFNDNYILTNKRVMHDEHIYLIRRSRVGAPLNNIQSVQRVQEGILAQAFDFADLLIETAGEPGGLVAFRQVPEPRSVQRKIFEQRDRLEAQARAEERVAIQEALRGRLSDRSPEDENIEGETVEASEEEERPRFDLRSWILAPVRVARYFFPALRYEEGDTITWRKHWVALLGPISRPTVVIALVTLIVAWLLGREDAWAPILFGYGVVLMFLVPWWLWVFEDWQNDIYQVTSSRIVDIEQLPFGLREERREASLGMIQNVNLRVPGLIGRMLGYGSVSIETAGAGAFTFDYVKNPDGVQTEIFRRMDTFKAQERQRSARRRRDELLDWFTVYDQMRHPEAEQESGPLPPSSREESAADTSSSS